MSAPISGRRNAFRSGPVEKSGTEGATAASGRVSGRRKKAHAHATRERPAANRPGAASPRCTAKPPIAGPKMNPSAKAMPIIPIPRALSAGAVESAMTACAVPMLPPVAPSRIRDAKRTASECANANRRYPITVPASEKRITGRRPYRSERRPRIGAQMNWSAE